MHENMSPLCVLLLPRRWTEIFRHQDDRL